MKYFLDLEGIADSFYEKHGLIEIDKAMAESMVANDDTLELAEYTVAEPEFTTVRCKIKPVAKDDKVMAENFSAVDRLYETMRDFTVNLIDWDGEDLQNSVIADMTPHLTPEARAMLVFLLLTVGHADTELEVNREGKQFAVVLAEIMGDDWAQWLYSFAKTVTKLA